MDKIDRLLDAIEHPVRYSKTDIEAMLADPEIRAVYDLMDKTKASLTPISTPDIEAEWNTFKCNHSVSKHDKKRSSWIFNRISRNVAASIAIGIGSLAAVAAVVGVGINYVLDKNTEAPDTTTNVSLTKEDIVSNDTITSTVDIPAIAPEIIVCDNQPFETIANDIAVYYGYTVEFSTDASKTLRLYFRWNQAQTLDEVVESLNNFEQIHLTVNGKTIKID